MKRWLPRADVAGWHGATDDGTGDVRGHSLVIQWGWLFLEINWGRVR